CRIRGNKKDVFLEPSDVTVASVLKQAGYRTGIFGKWGLGGAGSPGVPNLHGFDEWFGYLDQSHAHTYYPDHLWENQREFYGSEQEFDESRISGCFLEDHKFGSRGDHALGFQKQIA